MTTVDEACLLIASRMPRVPATDCALDESAGRILRETVYSDRDQPPFDRVTMDGIAIRHATWAAGGRRFVAKGVQSAGLAALSVRAPDECIDVMTGAVLPEGTDSVIPVERIERDGAVRIVQNDAQVGHGQFVHRRGSDRPAGVHLLEPGALIGPAEIAALASAGRRRVSVAPLLEIAVISTGNELVDVDQVPLAHQIRSTNDYSIAASLQRHGIARCERVRLEDDPAAMETALAALYESKDSIVLTGGVSMGQFDFVPSVLAKLGVENVFHRIEQRPGRPMWFGIGPGGKPVFALPGNPVSTLVCLTRYVLPALRQALGARSQDPEWAVLTAPVERSTKLIYFVPAKLAFRNDGVIEAEPRITNTSGDFMSLIGTDGFVELPPGDAPWPAGHVAQWFRW